MRTVSKVVIFNLDEVLGFHAHLIEHQMAHAVRDPNHELQFYSDDAAFLLGATYFIEAALKAGRPVIVVATESHRTSLLETLLARGVDGAAAIEQGLYLPLDVDEALSKFMVNNLADSVRYPKFLGDLVSSSVRAANAKQPELQLLVRSRLRCGCEATRMRRLRSNRPRRSWPRRATWIFFAGMY